MTTLMPAIFSAIGAVSRLDPGPKLLPATIMSPGWTNPENCSSTPSMACWAIVPNDFSRYCGGEIRSVLMLSPYLKTLPCRRLIRNPPLQVFARIGDFSLNRRSSNGSG